MGILFYREHEQDCTALSQLCEIEKGKITCAAKLFEQLSSSDIKFGKVDSFDTLMNLVK